MGKWSGGIAQISGHYDLKTQSELSRMSNERLEAEGQRAYNLAQEAVRMEFAARGDLDTAEANYRSQLSEEVHKINQKYFDNPLLAQKEGIRLEPRRTPFDTTSSERKIIAQAEKTESVRKAKREVENAKRHLEYTGNVSDELSEYTFRVYNEIKRREGKSK